ncbi:hypothetical protein V7793_18850 [Streptomyces sp. KLMMK]|uniref:hypothetical protein n=1 Tax=Streptomyces sp. KLMMK TaxID=3109353 RepID=UPI003009CCA1
MRNTIRRLTAWLRIGREPATQAAPAAPGASAPAAPAAPAAPVVPAAPAAAAQEKPAACGIYVWATAHGIDLRPRHSLLACACSTRAERATPAVGAFVVDARGGRLAQVVAAEGARLRLRPPAGGEAWEAEPALLRPATEAEQLSAKVAEANRASRWGYGAGCD